MEDNAATAEVLQRIVQLVVLCIPLITLPLILKSSSSLLGKIANNTDRFLKAAKIEGGLNAAQSGMRGGMKNKALNTEARMARSENGALNRIGGYRARRKFRHDQQATSREKAQEQGLENYYAEKDGSGNLTRRAEKRLARAAGIGGAEGQARVRASIDSLALQRQIEEMKPAKLKLEAKDLAIKSAELQHQGSAEYLAGGSRRANYLNEAFAKASSKEEREALANLAMQNGASGRDQVGQWASSFSPGSQEAQDFAASLGKNHYQALEQSRPDITTGFIDNAGQNTPGSQSFESQFKKVDASNVAALDDATFAAYTARAASAGPGDEAGLHARQVLVEAAAQKSFTQSKVSAMPAGFHEVLQNDVVDYKRAPFS